MKQPSHPDYSRDPCCSQAAALTYCCKAQNQPVNVTILKQGFQATLQCKNLNYMNTLLADAVNSQYGSDSLDL